MANMLLISLEIIRNFHKIYIRAVICLILMNMYHISFQDCIQVPTDGKRHIAFNSSYGLYDGNLNQLNPPINSEIKDGQWLGVEVQSQGEGGKVIVCAHR